MSKREEKSWSLWCDWPGCEYQWEYAEFSIFGDGWDADEIVRDSDGWLGDGKHYCNAHPATWSSDHEDSEPYPAAPFLLIHDGDAKDDGSVSFIEHLHAGAPCVPGRGVYPSAVAAEEAAAYDALTIDVVSR